MGREGMRRVPAASTRNPCELPSSKPIPSNKKPT
ncbi:hypothetical protein CCACVL1_01843 [Corchorus capsularis]|uniref:Uncharacterized protein n=1 Tax=Corchorus capsularis TaxID=210143 RepID=A0A1R3KF50_COCAP|nr:hypothetical protein CCACVL1_01843 [Corchorus capsularis]